MYSAGCERWRKGPGHEKQAKMARFSCLWIGVVVWHCACGVLRGSRVLTCCGRGYGRWDGPRHEKRAQTGTFFVFFMFWRGGGMGMLPVR